MMYKTVFYFCFLLKIPCKVILRFSRVNNLLNTRVELIKLYSRDAYFHIWHWCFLLDGNLQIFTYCKSK